jgi:hypothetical protein
MAHFNCPPADVFGSEHSLNTSNNTAWPTEGKREFFKKRIFFRRRARPVR